MSLTLVYRQRLQTLGSSRRWPNLNLALKAAQQYCQTLTTENEEDNECSSPLFLRPKNILKKGKGVRDSSEEELEEVELEEEVTDKDTTSLTSLMNNLAVVDIVDVDDDDADADDTFLSPIFKRSKRKDQKLSRVFLDEEEEEEEEEEEDDAQDIFAVSPLPLIVDLTNRNHNTPTKKSNRTTVSTNIPSKTPAQWRAHRNIIVRDSLVEFNQTVFGGKLDESLVVDWSTRLTKTAGMTYMSRTSTHIKEHKARIELASKVCTNEERVRATLLHELCHVAAWVVDGVRKPPHGPIFKKWGKRCTKIYPDLAVSRCHNYSIEFKYIYRCINYGSSCEWEMGRHSKSVNTKKMCCGRCRGKIMEPLVVGADGVPRAAKALTEYQLFQKKQFDAMKNSGLNFAEKNKEISKLWRNIKM